MKVFRHELAAHRREAVEQRIRFRNHFAPAIAGRRGEAGFIDVPARSFPVRRDVEGIARKGLTELRNDIVHNGHDRAMVLYILSVERGLLGTGPVHNGVHEIGAILGKIHDKNFVLAEVLPENHLIVGHIRSHRVVIRARPCRRCPCVVDSAIVRRGHHAEVIRGWKDVGKIVAGFQIENVHRHFVLAALAASVENERAVAAHRFETRAHRMILAPGKRIDEHLVAARHAAAHVNQREVLVRRALREEIAAGALDRNRVLIVVIEIREPLGNRVTPGDFRKRGVGACVLGIDPRARFGALLIFEPLVGIGNDGPAVGIRDVVGARGRRALRRWRSLSCGCCSEASNQNQRETETQKPFAGADHGRADLSPIQLPIEFRKRSRWSGAENAR